MASLEAIMPTTAKTPFGADKEELAKYRAGQALNHKAVAPILKDIQGRRTGLVIDNRISKDSEGFEDIDAFWEMASQGDESSLRGARRSDRRATNLSVGRYSRDSQGLALGLDSLPGEEGGRRSSASSLGAPLSEDVVSAKKNLRSSSLPAEAVAAARSRRRSSTLSYESSSPMAGSTPLSDGPGFTVSPEGMAEDDHTPAGLSAAARLSNIKAPSRRLDFLLSQKESLGGGAVVLGQREGKEGGGESEGESEAPTEEEFEGTEDAAAVAAVAGRRRSSASNGDGGGFVDDWGAGGADEYLDEGVGEEPVEEPVEEEVEEAREEKAELVGTKEKKKGKTVAREKKAVERKKKGGKSQASRPRAPESERDTEVSSYEDEGEDKEERRKTQERFRRLRLSEYNREMGGKSLLQEGSGEGGGEGPVGERRSTRRKVQPLQFWKNERVLYAVESTEGVDERRRREEGGKEGGREEAVDCMAMKEVLVANQTPVAPRRRKRKGGRGGGREAKRGKGEEGKEVQREAWGEMDPERVYKKHPNYTYVRDGQGKGRVWDERKALRTTRRVVMRVDQVVMRPLENEEEDGVALEAGHAFRVLQVARSREDRAAHEPSLAGYPGWVAGHMTLMPRKGKDPENVGPCSQVFHVLACEKNALELAVGELGEDAFKFNEEAATRFLLGPGDSFHLPPMNVYKLYNHSKRGPAKVFWTIVKPWSEEEEEGGAGGAEGGKKGSTGGKDTPVAAKRGRKSSVVTGAGKGGRKRPSMPVSAVKENDARSQASESEEEELEVSSGEESESEQGEEASESDSSGSDVSE